MTDRKYVLRAPGTSTEGDPSVTTTNATVNYHLPLWEGQDVTSYLTQMNDAMNKIDTGMHENKVANQNVEEIIKETDELLKQATIKFNELKEWENGVNDNVDAALKASSQALAEAQQSVGAVANIIGELHSLQDVVNANTDDILKIAGTQAKLVGTVTNMKADVIVAKNQAQTAKEEVDGLSTVVQDMHTEVINNTVSINQIAGTVTQLKSDVNELQKNNTKVRMVYSLHIHEQNFFGSSGPGGTVDARVQALLIGDYLLLKMSCSNEVSVPSTAANKIFEGTITNFFDTINKNLNDLGYNSIDDFGSHHATSTRFNTQANGAVSILVLESNKIYIQYGKDITVSGRSTIINSDTVSIIQVTKAS